LIAERRQALRPARPGVQAGDPGVRRRPLPEHDVEPVVRQQGPGPLGPFDQPDLVRFRRREAELGDLGSVLEAIQIDMPDHQAGERVVLDQGEARARDLDRGAGARPDQSAGQFRLAAAERAAERHHVAAPQRRGEPPAERPRRAEIVEPKLGPRLHGRAAAPQ
jgi:hypothetical protein